MPYSRPARWFLSVSVICVAALACGAFPPGLARQQTPSPPAAVTDARLNETPTVAAAENVYTLHVTVTDEKGNLVEGLKQDAFTVFDGDEELKIASFSAADAPASIGVVLDASGSMGVGDLPAKVRNALLHFFSKCHEADEFFMGAFNQGQQLLLDKSNDPAAILSALDRYGAAELKGQTAFYDALYLALNRVGGGKHQRRAVLVISDGLDNASNYTYLEVKRAVLESDVAVYAVGLGGDHTELDISGRAILGELTKLSGGMVVYPHNEKGLNEAAVYLASLLRSQYAIGVVAPPKTKKRGWHEIKVKVARGLDAKGKSVKLVARARKGFYDAAAR